MLKEIIKNVINERRGGPTQGEWKSIKNVLLKRYKDAYKIDKNKYTPFTYISDDGKIIISREGMPSGYRWRLGVGTLSGTNGNHNIDCLMEKPKELDKFLAAAEKFIRSKNPSNDELGEWIVKELKKYC